METGRTLAGRIAAQLVRIRFVREALAERADLSGLAARPTLRAWTGLGLMAFSYVIGWPAVAVLAWLAYRLSEPLVVALGGPLVYGLSHLVFLAGAALAGADYARAVLRWATRRLVERLAGPAAAALPETEIDRPEERGVGQP